MITLGITTELPTLKTGKHFDERASRLKDCSKDATIEQIFIVEKEGREQLHMLLTNCTIIVVDKVIGRIITVLNAREGQLKRLYHSLNMEVPQYLVELARYGNGRFNN